MTTIYSRRGFERERLQKVNFRKLAEHHAFGAQPESAPEKQRIFNLALNEAEALACQTGVPELVLLTLAEEKVQTARHWFNRQQAVKRRSAEWQIAA
jgi:hypothetical protein